MSVLEYIILSFALSVPVMVTLRGCALKNPIRLTRGLGVSFLIALEQTLLFLAGMWVSNMLRFDIPDYDNLFFLGLMVVVALRLFFPAFRKKDKERVPYDISRWGTVGLLGVATGVNTLFIGLAFGFLFSISEEMWKVAVPLMVILFLLCYLAIMMGRRKKQMRERRWQLIAVLFLLVFAIKGAFFGN
ncbi:MAG: manganese efflux pump [Bacteroidales bacterium]|nr:manganese efflux pump [Bacteroidales bacterium]